MGVANTAEWAVVAVVDTGTFDTIHYCGIVVLCTLLV